MPTNKPLPVSTVSTPAARGLLNAVELFAMNSPIRRFAQRHREFRCFVRMLEASGTRLHNARILDAGCGSGFGTRLIADAFEPRRLVGIDAMATQVERAQKRAVRAGMSAEIREGDLTAIIEPDESFDAVFVFAVLHHVPEWRRAVREIARVLAPGGALVIEELDGAAVRFADRFLGTEHPRSAAFTWKELRDELSRAGFALRGETPVYGDAVRAFLAVKSPDDSCGNAETRRAS